MRLEHSSWAQVKAYFEQEDTVIVPLGSVENHGSHMGLGTDFLIPDHLVDRVSRKIEVLSTPTMPYGMADHHIEFPGTLTIGHDGLYLVMSRIADQLYDYGARHIVFLNGHGGNTPVLNRVGVNMARKGCLCAIIDWWSLAGKINPAWKGGHAGAEETSAMLAINSDWVHMEYAMPFEPKDLSDELKFAGANDVFCDGVAVTVPRPVAQYSDAGWFGNDDIRDASVQWGEEMLEGVSDFIASFIEKFRRAACPRVE